MVTPANLKYMYDNKYTHILEAILKKNNLQIEVVNPSDNYMMTVDKIMVYCDVIDIYDIIFYCCVNNYSELLKGFIVSRSYGNTKVKNYILKLLIMYNHIDTITFMLKNVSPSVNVLRQRLYQAETLGNKEGVDLLKQALAKSIIFSCLIKHNSIKDVVTINNMNHFKNSALYMSHLRNILTLYNYNKNITDTSVIFAVFRKMKDSILPITNNLYGLESLKIILNTYEKMYM